MKTTKGGSGHVGPLRSPMAAPMHGLLKKGAPPKVAANTMRTDIGTGAAKIRSAATAGKVIKPW